LDRWTAFALAFSIVVLSISSAYYFGGFSTTTSSIQVVITGVQITGRTTNSTLGLELFASMSSEYIESGQTFAVNITEYNIRNSSNTVLADSNYLLGGLSASPCNVAGFPFGMDLYKGNYGMNNISLLNGNEDLSFFYPGPISCPVIPVIGSYSFAPLSDNVLRGDLPNGSAAYIPMETVIYVNGTWTPYPGTRYLEFQGGPYTIAAGDEWGDLVLLHFYVKLTLPP
jgi:hypothetical protein